ncbi:MAG: HEAT repeat domain-containing protein [Planctomycetota bacterium]
MKKESNFSAVSNYVEVESFDADQEDALWGEPVEGLRIRLRAEEPLQLTPTPTFRMDIRNHSENEYRLVLTPSSWEFNVNGKTYRGSTFHYGRPPILTIGPREEHKGLLIPLDKEYGWQCGDEPLRFIHGRHTFAVTVRIDRLTPGGGSLRISSKPIELEVSSKVRLLPAWSRHAEGFQIRAHAAKYRWQIGETPIFKAYLRNLGPHSALVPLVYQNGWEVEVDGKWHHCPIRNTALPYPLTPYTQHDNIAIELLGEWQGKPLWVGKADKQALKLSPGFHEIRVALPFGCKMVEGEDKPLRLLSEPFEIEIVPDAPKAAELVWGKAVNGLRAAVEFIPEKASYGFGAKIGLRFHFQNVSNRDIQFVSDTWRQEQRCVVEDENGKTLPVSHSVYSGWTPVERYYLKPGETTAIDSSAFGIAANNEQADKLGYPVGHQFVCKPGTYFVRFPLIIPNVKSSAVPEQEEDFHGVLETGRRKFTVTAAPDTNAKTVPAKSRDGPERVSGRTEAGEMREDSQKQAFAARNMYLSSGLEDKLKEVSGRTAKKLADLGEAAVPALLDELWSTPLEYYNRRTCIGRGLEQIGKPAAPYLIEVVRGQIPAVSAGGKEYEKVITARCMYVVIPALGRIGEKKAVEPLIELFDKNKTASVRWTSAIAAALGSIGDKRAVEPLILELDATLKRAADSDNWDAENEEMRTYAETLGRLGDKRAIEVLTKALRAGPQTTKPGKRYVIAEEAAEALQSLGVKVEGENGNYRIVDRPVSSAGRAVLFAEKKTFKPGEPVIVELRLASGDPMAVFVVDIRGYPVKDHSQAATVFVDGRPVKGYMSLGMRSKPEGGVGIVELPPTTDPLPDGIPKTFDKSRIAVPPKYARPIDTRGGSLSLGRFDLGPCCFADQADESGRRPFELPGPHTIQIEYSLEGILAYEKGKVLSEPLTIEVLSSDSEADFGGVSWWKLVEDFAGGLKAVGGKMTLLEVDPNAGDVLRRYGRALQQSDWDAALALCSDGVRKEAAKYPSVEAFFRAVVPIEKVLAQQGRPRTGYWPNPPKYFAYFFDVRIPQPGFIRDVWWVWMVRRLEGQESWEIDFPAVAFESWLAKEKGQIERAAKEHQRRIEELAPRFEGVKTVLSAERKEWVVGEPVYVNLELVNQSTSLLRYDDQQVGVNHSMTITDAKGRKVKYVAPLVQTMGASKKIEPGQTHALLDRFDITEQYAIRKPGQYQVQFSGRGLQVGVLTEKNADPEDPTSFIPYPDEMPSNVITIAVHSSIPDSLVVPDAGTGISLEGRAPVARPRLVWGERANDLQAAVEFVPEGGTFSLGRKIGIRFHIRNVGRELRILGASKPFHDAVQCIITDSRGRRVSGGKNNYLGELMHVQRWLLPGQTVVFEGMPLGIAGSAELSHPVGFVFKLRPGRYTLRYELGRMGGLATGSRPFVVTAARPSIAADEPHIADSAAEPEKPMLESKGRTSWAGAFELDKDIPAGLDCPAVRDKWRFYQRPLRIESMRFASKDGRLSCSFNICSAEVADGAFLVRLMIRGRQYRGAPDEVLLGAGEFLFKTRGEYSTLPRMSRESYELDVESMDRFRYAETFEIVIEDLSAVARRGERRPNITEFRGTYKKTEPIGVNLDCPVVKDVWGNDSRPFKVESVEFAEKDGRLRCSVKLDGATTADGQFIIRVKIFGKDVSVPEAESILGLRGFLFETQCAYSGLPAVVRRTRNLDLGPIDRFTVATRFEVEIENVTERAGRGKVKS